MLASKTLVELINSKPIFVLFALITHHILHTGEWDLKAHYIVNVWIVFFGACTVTEYRYDKRVTSFREATQFTTGIASVYFGTLVASVLIHRGFLHRLGKIPGPFFARFTKWYVVAVGVFPRFQLYGWIEKLHQEYDSDVIRTGPREVTIFCADAIPIIHGPMTRCTKGPWYQSIQHLDGESTHTTRDKEEHRRRRKDWDRALSAKALRDYEPRLNRYALLLMTKLKEAASQPSVRISDWFNFYSFDVMSDIGFNTSFQMLEKGEENPIIALLHASMSAISILGQVTWLFCLLAPSRLTMRPVVDHITWTQNVLKKRIKTTPTENDIVSWLVDSENPEFTLKLGADARLLVVAGSDTTSATLSWTVYELCKNPDVQVKLRKYVDEIEPSKPHLEVSDLNSCEYLDGVVNEAMRLHPAVPSGVQRETPPEGLQLPNGTFIPGNILVWMPMHTIQRDPRYFKEPLTFMPERWTSERTDALMDKRAFMPFSYGSYNCSGRKLAMIEMRTVLANLVRNFEFEFAQGETGKNIEGSVDCFTTNIGTLDVLLTPRQK